VTSSKTTDKYVSTLEHTDTPTKLEAFKDLQKQQPPLADQCSATGLSLSPLHGRGTVCRPSYTVIPGFSTRAEEIPVYALLTTFHH